MAGRHQEEQIEEPANSSTTASRPFRPMDNAGARPGSASVGTAPVHRKLQPSATPCPQRPPRRQAGTGCVLPDVSECRAARPAFQNEPLPPAPRCRLSGGCRFYSGRRSASFCGSEGQSARRRRCLRRRHAAAPSSTSCRARREDIPRRRFSCAVRAVVHSAASAAAASACRRRCAGDARRAAAREPARRVRHASPPCAIPHRRDAAAAAADARQQRNRFPAAHVPCGIQVREPSATHCRAGE